MQIKALRSRNFAKLSSSNSTRDEYWVTSISAGTPDGYCLSQMRSMAFPLWVTFPLLGTGSLVLSDIEHCRGQWQATSAPRPEVCRLKSAAWQDLAYQTWLTRPGLPD